MEPLTKEQGKVATRIGAVFVAYLGLFLILIGLWAAWGWPIAAIVAGVVMLGLAAFAIGGMRE